MDFNAFTECSFFFVAMFVLLSFPDPRKAPFRGLREGVQSILFRWRTRRRVSEVRHRHVQGLLRLQLLSALKFLSVLHFLRRHFLL
jgi:hypothetical protein